jgi:hypothetical protein
MAMFFRFADRLIVQNVKMTGVLQLSAGVVDATATSGSSLLSYCHATA